MGIKIALVGTQTCGKTTMFNTTGAALWAIRCNVEKKAGAAMRGGGGWGGWGGGGGGLGGGGVIKMDN